MGEEDFVDVAVLRKIADCVDAHPAQIGLF
jgi:hypothetical protein